MGKQKVKQIIDGYAAKCGKNLLKKASNRIFLHLMMFALIDHKLEHIKGIWRELH